MDPVGKIGAACFGVGVGIPAAKSEMNIKRIYCFFGKHKPSKPFDFKVPIYPHVFWKKKLIFCERCNKILFMGTLPPEHPNCLCVITNADLET